MDKPQVLILAGGLGKRLRPITETIPKPLVPVNGRPFLDYFFNLLKSQGFSDFILCVGYLNGKIIEHYQTGNRLDINIKYSIENTPLGTGGAIKNAARYIEKDFFVLNGDTFLSVDYNDIYNKFIKSGLLGIMAVYKNSNPKIEKNNIKVDNNLIIEYNKNDEKNMKYVDAGVSLFNHKILQYLPDEPVFSFEEVIFKKLIENKQLNAYVTDQRYYDIGTVERLKVFEEYAAAIF